MWGSWTLQQKRQCKYFGKANISGDTKNIGNFKTMQIMNRSNAESGDKMNSNIGIERDKNIEIKRLEAVIRAGNQR